MILPLLLLFVKSPVGIWVDPSVTIRSFHPARLFGADVDGHEKGDSDRIFTEHNISEMRSAGLSRLSYRLRTELADEAWHWNPDGAWSDPAHQEGYWTSSPIPGKPIEVSYGYKLLRRGNTNDQANDDGYSRLDDGDPATYWKSNPYLDPLCSHDYKQTVPQWIVADLGAVKPIDTIHVNWANPFAVKWAVDVWNGKNAIQLAADPNGDWKNVSTYTTKAPGMDIRLLPTRLNARYIRVRLLDSSHTQEQSAHADLRDRCGFAVRELNVGTIENGTFTDLVHHTNSKLQTVMYTSSTDPWHRSVDLDPRVEQPGFDRVYKSLLTAKKPALIPVPVLYDTPENTAAEVAWLKKRKYPVSAFEMGEEPDGQYVSPEHYAALYSLSARYIRRVDDTTRLGGPCFQNPASGSYAWADGDLDRSWVHRFLNYLKAHHRMRDFQFFSFEWYPFDSVSDPVTPHLAEAPILLQDAMTKLRKEGLPRTIPWMITEFGYSGSAGLPEVNLPGAIFNMDTVGSFLALGGAQTYLYGFEPDQPITEQEGQYGNLMMLEHDESGRAKWRLPTYWGAKLLTQTWCSTSEGAHRLVNTVTSSPLISAYSVVRPDGKVAVMILNKDSSQAHTIDLEVQSKNVVTGKVITYGPENYAWKDAGKEGRPSRSDPPSERNFEGPLTMSPLSVAVAILR